MEKRVADIIIDTLINNGITNAFSVVGGGSMHLNNAFVLRKSEIKTVYNHHEQACAMAAESYARLTGKPAVVCVTSGPGGLNTLTGVQSAWVDSVPMIVIAGHPRYSTTVEYSGLNVRCIGVQENNIIEQVKSITKYAKMVTDPLSVRRAVQYAIDTAMDGRRGPVWLSIPLDVQGAHVEETDLYETKAFESEVPAPTGADMNDLLCALSKAKRPCILTGSGIVVSSSQKEYRQFLEYVDVPIVGGFSSTDLNHSADKNYYGTSGAIGPRCGNFILQNADFVLVLGNGLSTYQTGYNVEAFAAQADIYMVDAQRDEGRKPGLNIARFIHADLKAFFLAFCKCGKKISADNNWKAYCDFLYSDLPWYEVLDLLPESDGSEAVHPTQFWKSFLERVEDNAVIALGNSGCNDPMLLEGVCSAKQRVSYNYRCGSMGCDLPFAIGAKEAFPDAPIYCVTGDGSFMMNIQELQTIKHNYSNIKIVIFGNNGYDDIRNTCVNFFHGLKNGCDPESGISLPNFDEVAAAFGYHYKKVSCTSELRDGVEWLIEAKESCILEIKEKENKERAPVIKSVMNKQGQFETPPLHIMSPLMSEDVLQKYMYREGKNYAAID